MNACILRANSSTFFALALMMWGTLSSAQMETAPTSEVRVRLKSARTVVDVSGLNMKISQPSMFIEVETNPGFHRASISSSQPGEWKVSWDHRAEPVTVRSDNLWVRGDFLSLGLEVAPYDLELQRRVDQVLGIDVIAHLDLETYVQGVLPAEMPASWPLEALKAQAVSARSYVISQAGERRGKNFDVESSILDQVYKFKSVPATNKEWTHRVRRAVEATHGEVLLDSKRKVLKAYYSADCGCQSEDPKYVWGKLDSSFQSVKDPTCGMRKQQLWNVILGRNEIKSKLAMALNLSVGETIVKTVQVGRRTPSGRVNEVVASLEVQGKTHNFNINSQEFRRIFGFQRVRSTEFKLRWLADRLHISGQGLGHGVGLCQHGARTMAEEGMSYRDILKVYYPRATLYQAKPEKIKLSRH